MSSRNPNTSSGVPFVKMHGAGNDFVMFDGRDLPGGVIPGPEAIAAICDRRLGVGADGLIVIGPGREGVTEFRMTYFNADGGEAEMCGNGARCSVAFAAALGLVRESCVFDTGSGLVSATVHTAQDITVELAGWQGVDLDVTMPDSPWARQCTCNTGVPHLIIVLDDADSLAAVDLMKWGPGFRHDPLFAPVGTNVNWIARGTRDPEDRPESGDEFHLRTYERGVEAETLACGTGASAAAVILCLLGEAVSPVRVRTRGGDLLRIKVDQIAGRIDLRGPAAVSFVGTVELKG